VLEKLSFYQAAWVYFDIIGPFFCACGLPTPGNTILDLLISSILQTSTATVFGTVYDDKP